jgi:hypothetical protein
MRKECNSILIAASLCFLAPLVHAATDAQSIDQRKGVTLDKLIKENPSSLTYTQQSGGDKPLYSELFNPTLAVWNKQNSTIKYSSSNFVYEGNTVVPQPPKKIEEVSDLSRIQYFYKQSLHAELIGPRANEILKYTHSKGGKVYISTAVVKVYPTKSYEDIDTKQKETSQCIDIITRITVTKVPMITSFGLENLIDYWHDIKNYQCRSNAPTD